MTEAPIASSAPTLERTTGLLLAGGQGLRMQGQDKGLLPLQGRPLVAHVLERLQPQVAGVLISANRNIEQYSRYGWPVLSDAPDAARIGPLAGWLTGLQHCLTDWLLSVPCDSPLLPPDLQARLAAGAIAQNARMAVAMAASDLSEPGRLQMQPVFCLMHRDLTSPLAGFLNKGGRKLEAFVRTQAAVEVVFDRPGDEEAFFNANRPDELRDLELTLAQRSP